MGKGRREELLTSLYGVLEDFFEGGLVDLPHRKDDFIILLLLY